MNRLNCERLLAHVALALGDADRRWREERVRVAEARHERDVARRVSELQSAGVL